MKTPAPLLFGCVTAVAMGATAGDSHVSLAEWLALTDGKTVYYEVEGAPAGREYFPPGESFAVFEGPNGDCFEGPWAHTDDRFCFWYGASFQCFYSERRAGAIYLLPDTGGAEQKISRITEGEPFFCPG